MRPVGRRAPVAILIASGLLAASFVSGPTSTATIPPPTISTATKAVRWTQTTHGLSVGRTTRTYLLVRPPALSHRTLPVVIVLHGRNTPPALEELRTGFRPLVGRAILVYPAGYRDSWNAGACCGPAHLANVDDVGFLARLVHHVLDAQHDAARGRVFLVGFSNGGRMAERLSCASPGMFAGVAVVGAMAVAPCPRRPVVPLIEVAYAGDPLVTLTAAQPHKSINGYAESSIEEEVTAQRQADGCVGPGDQKVEPGLTVTSWTSCPGNQRVELAVYQGNTHAWPRGDATRPSAGQLIWRFFLGLPST